MVVVVKSATRRHQKLPERCCLSFFFYEAQQSTISAKHKQTRLLLPNFSVFHHLKEVKNMAMGSLVAPEGFSDLQSSQKCEYSSSFLCAFGLFVVFKQIYQCQGSIEAHNDLKTISFSCVLLIYIHLLLSKH